MVSRWLGLALCLITLYPCGLHIEKCSYVHKMPDPDHPTIEIGLDLECYKQFRGHFLGCRMARMGVFPSGEYGGTAGEGQLDFGSIALHREEPNDHLHFPQVWPVSSL